MSQYFEVLDFPLDPSVHFCLIHFSQVYNLHGNFVPCQGMCRDYDRKGSAHESEQ